MQNEQIEGKPTNAAGGRAEVELLDDYERKNFYSLNPDKCPEAWAHTPCPPISDEILLDAWMDEMVKTHKQCECPGCGLFKIWRPRRPDEPYEEPELQECDII